MTRVEFIFNVEDKLAKAADLCEKAVAKGRQLTFAAAEATLCAQLQDALWQTSPSSFMPLLALHDKQYESAHFPVHFFFTAQKAVTSS